MGFCKQCGEPAHLCRCPKTAGQQPEIISGQVGCAPQEDISNRFLSSALNSQHGDVETGLARLVQGLPVRACMGCGVQTNEYRSTHATGAQLCPRCYVAQLPVCAACRRPIEEAQFSQDDRGARYHISCAAGSASGQRGGGSPNPVCAGCNARLSGEIMGIDENTLYHARCFVCAKCGTQLGESFKLRERKPYCSRC
eukprot:gnl/Spiro4/26273_TR13105_c0_g1_i1.p2 gnl/Spiro4/26273_TR13105_c0_g1~~gnl/Spiro4/26273_TR13105_c0_g1_i1.p2  ORF type:complete len:207 (+),score=27.92 gnl/Spiro4/26273_TR13105_c0_g1_i1:32-622(+)